MCGKISCNKVKQVSSTVVKEEEEYLVIEVFDRYKCSRDKDTCDGMTHS